MKILFINQSDIDGGAARAAHRLARQFVEMGHDVTMQVMRKLGNDSWVLGPGGFFLYVISRLFPRVELIIKRLIGVNMVFPWSLNLFANPILDEKFVNEFDVIHLHWVGKNMLPIEWIRKFRKPVVWTLHDSWPFTGGCHSPALCRRFEENCGHCPQLTGNANSKDISSKIWRRKSDAYSRTKIHFVAPSRWVADEAVASSLLRRLPVSVIPNGLDTNIFRPLGTVESRQSLGLPSDKGIILFGSLNAATDERKGMDLLIEAVNALVNRDAGFAKRNLVAIFGSNDASLCGMFRIPVVLLGMIKDDGKLASIYSAADVTVVPSRVESFGQVASESLSCGTPVVAFNATGLKDIIDHQETGYLANCFDTKDLADGINLLLQNSDRKQQICKCARERAVARFDSCTTGAAHLELYRQLLIK